MPQMNTMPQHQMVMGRTQHQFGQRRAIKDGETEPEGTRQNIVGSSTAEPQLPQQQQGQVGGVQTQPKGAETVESGAMKNNKATTADGIGEQEAQTDQMTATEIPLITMGMERETMEEEKVSIDWVIISLGID